MANIILIDILVNEVQLLLRARRASLASQGEGAHVPVYGKTKQLNISKNKDF